MNVVAEDKVKGMLITKTAIRTLLSEDTIEKLINFQFKNANLQVKTEHQIEISGLGKFMISKAKLRKQIKKMRNSVAKFQKELDNPETSDKRKEVSSRRLKQCVEALTYLEEKNQRYEN